MLFTLPFMILCGALLWLCKLQDKLLKKYVNDLEKSRDALKMQDKAISNLLNVLTLVSEGGATVSMQMKDRDGNIIPMAVLNNNIH